MSSVQKKSLKISLCHRINWCFICAQVKVFIDTGASPYRLSLHMCHSIVPEKCFMKIMKSKVCAEHAHNFSSMTVYITTCVQVELKMKKAEGLQWPTLDKRGILHVLSYVHCETVFAMDSVVRHRTHYYFHCILWQMEFHCWRGWWWWFHIAIITK